MILNSKRKWKENSKHCKFTAIVQNDWWKYWPKKEEQSHLYYTCGQQVSGNSCLVNKKNKQLSFPPKLYKKKKTFVKGATHLQWQCSSDSHQNSLPLMIQSHKEGDLIDLQQKQFESQRLLDSCWPLRNTTEKILKYERKGALLTVTTDKMLTWLWKLT